MCPCVSRTVVDGDDLVGGLADVEADVELRHADHRLLAGDRIAEEVQVVDLNAGQVVTGHFDLSFMNYEL